MDCTKFGNFKGSKEPLVTAPNEKSFTYMKFLNDEDNPTDLKVLIPKYNIKERVDAARYLKNADVMMFRSKFIMPVVAEGFSFRARIIYSTPLPDSTQWGDFLDWQYLESSYISPNLDVTVESLQIPLWPVDMEFEIERITTLYGGFMFFEGLQGEAKEPEEILKSFKIPQGPAGDNFKTILNLGEGEEAFQSWVNWWAGAYYFELQEWRWLPYDILKQAYKLKTRQELVRRYKPLLDEALRKFWLANKHKKHHTSN